jgi:hypothetical protein
MAEGVGRWHAVGHFRFPDASTDYQQISRPPPNRRLQRRIDRIVVSDTAPALVRST